MRHGRAKAARKTLQYFKQTVGLQTRPYLPVLVDGCFLVALFQYKIPIQARMDKLLQIKPQQQQHLQEHNGREEQSQSHGREPSPRRRPPPSSSLYTSSSSSFSSDGGNIKYFITHEAMAEVQEILASLEKRGKDDKAGAFREAATFIRQHCTVLKKQQQQQQQQVPPSHGSSESRTAKRQRLNNNNSRSNGIDSPAVNDNESAVSYSAQEALLHHIRDLNSRIYVVATQDDDLLNQLRAMGTVPIVRLANNSVLLLEQPSKSSQKQSLGEERRKWKSGLGSAELALVKVAKDQIKASNKNSRTTVKGGTAADPPPAFGRRKHKAKGANPLSCKRKQA